MKKWTMIALAGAALTAAAPASAQDYLGSFLQTEQSHRVSELSQPEDGGNQKVRPTPAARQAAWNRHKKEYRQRLLRDGKKSADAWLDEQARLGR